MIMVSALPMVIIGSGPAGFTAAIYAARASMTPTILEGGQPGGQLTTTTEIENFPGFEEGITGSELMEKMKRQAVRFGATVVSTSAISVDLSSRPFQIKCENGDTLLASSLIVSTGASAKYLGLPREQELLGRGVSACATCDGFFYKGRVVHVVGGGDTAMEEALFLAKFASKVSIVHRRDALRASQAMQQRVLDHPAIDVVWDSTVTEILADNSGVTGIKVKNIKSGEILDRQTDGLFMGIGHNPNTEFLAGQVELDSAGFIVTGMGGKTSVPGVYACGDVQDPIFRQAITAAGSGCMAAIAAEEFLATN
jgi:thioredoxin reductase (NADPH)